MCVLMCNFVSYFVCVILSIFVFLCDILLPSGVINDDDSILRANITQEVGSPPWCSGGSRSGGWSCWLSVFPVSVSILICSLAHWA